MNKEELKEVIDKILEYQGDYERAHAREDDLHKLLIKEHCPAWVQEELERLWGADFPRYCA